MNSQDIDYPHEFITVPLFNKRMPTICQMLKTLLNKMNKIPHLLELPPIIMGKT